MGKQYLKKKIIPKTDFILLSEIVSEAKEKFEGWNLSTQLYSYLNLQTKIHNATKEAAARNKVKAKHTLALLLINAIDYAHSKEARN
ncbi:TPA: hypothetical protein DD449_03980 [Candidatus Berkelbacteria bacterium]|nr:hypothetical protein [Candidatus Berkelbacteria bacterium]